MRYSHHFHASGMPLAAKTKLPFTETEWCLILQLRCGLENRENEKKEFFS
jgi:hypothetical protein